MSTLKDLSRLVAERTDLTRNEAEEFVSAVFDVAKETLSIDDIVKIKGLGTFKRQNVRQRASVNVNTGEKVIIDSHDRISFTPDNSLRDSVNKPFAHFETVVLNDGVVFDDIESASDSSDSSDSSDELSSDVEPEEEEAVMQEPADPVYPDTQVLEPMAPEVETVMTETVVMEPVTDIPEPTPLPEVEPIPQPEVEPNPQPEYKPTPQPVAEIVENVINDKEMQDEDYYDRVNPSIDRSYSRTDVFVGVLLALVILIAGFALGRYTSDITMEDVLVLTKMKERPRPVKVVYGNVKHNELIPVDTAKVEESKQKKDSTAKDVQPVIPTVGEQSAVAKKVVPATPKPAAVSTKPANEKKVGVESKPADEYTADKYNSDPRIKHGAYIIVGVDHTVKAASGQTIESISRANLGPGMECYVEALNGKEIKAGQVVKIPKLKLKKKSK